MFRRRKPLNTSQRLRQFLWPREGWVRATLYLWQRTIGLMDRRTPSHWGWQSVLLFRPIHCSARIYCGVR